MWEMRSVCEFRVNDCEKKKTISPHIYGQQLCLGAHKLSGSPKALKLDLNIEILKYHIIDACQKEIPIGRHRVCVTGSLELVTTVSQHTFLNVSGSSNFSDLLIVRMTKTRLTTALL